MSIGGRSNSERHTSQNSPNSPNTKWEMIYRFKGHVRSKEKWRIDKESILVCCDIPIPDVDEELWLQQLGIEGRQVNN